MRILAIFLVVISLAACAATADAVDIYKFKKDRVDQSLGGNRGYISGKPEGLPESAGCRKRTLIGIDIELPAGSYPGGKDLPQEEAVSAEETVTKTRGGKEKVVHTEEAESWIK